MRRSSERHRIPITLTNDSTATASTLPSLDLDSDDPLLSEAEAAKAFPPRGISKRTLVRYRDDGKIAFVRIAGRIYYKTSDIRDCVDALRVVPRALRAS
jgi:hypothetical protein